jgi:hypothetical protein
MIVCMGVRLCFCLLKVDCKFVVLYIHVYIVNGIGEGYVCYLSIYITFLQVGYEYLGSVFVANQSKSTG